MTKERRLLGEMDLEQLQRSYQFGLEIRKKVMITIEPILQYLRFLKIRSFIPTGGVLVDIGCNNPPYTIHKMRSVMSYCVGIDAEVEDKTESTYELKKCFIKKIIPAESEFADVITMLAVLEHFDYPKAIIEECYRVLKPGGVLLLTVPSPINKRPLEFLSEFGIVQKKMIDQHKKYFSHYELEKMLSEAGFRNNLVSSFQLGLNTLARSIK